MLAFSSLSLSSLFLHCTGLVHMEVPPILEVGLPLSLSENISSQTRPEMGPLGNFNLRHGGHES